MLVDSCMHRLSPNAWKVVSYVAAQHLRVHPEWLASIRNPPFAALQRDLEKMGFPDAPGESGERPYRSNEAAPAVPGQRVGRFALISLAELCDGKRIGRLWRDRGTGLSKSSVAEAIKEAVGTGILVHERRKSGHGRDLSSGYAINWDRVQEYDWRRRKSPK
jgi:hypothetical protein